MDLLSLNVLNIVALSKIILFVFVLLFVLILFKKNKPILHLLLLTGALLTFYLIFSYPLQKMFWGNRGDETFIFAFLNNVLHGNYFQDFYYSHLPVFYAPLYFWVTGFCASFITTSGITAAKIGTLGAILIWFLGTYFWQKFYWQKINDDKLEQSVVNSNWFWLLYPVIYFLILDFDTIISKPYEALAALLSPLFVIFLTNEFELKKWDFKKYLFFAFSGAFIFLTYYFWWFILIPVFLVLVYFSTNKFLNFKRLIILGGSIFLLSSIYLVPLIISIIRYGIENWQANFLMPEDFNSFFPWLDLSLKSILFILGIFSLIFFNKNKIIRANLIGLIFCYAYQLINIFLFVIGKKPFALSKPFLFLGGSFIIFGATYLIIFLYKKLLMNLSLDNKKIIILVIALFFIPLLPFGNFIDKPSIRWQIEEDLQTPTIQYMVEIFQQKIPNYTSITWLSAGMQEINAYLPLKYYIAYNPHFSHQASIYSQRMNLVKKLVSSKNSEDFYALTQNEAKPKITGLFLYKNETKENYSMFFWQDNYPNGGKELEIRLPKNLIDEKFWELKYEDKKFIIFLTK